MKTLKVPTCYIKLIENMLTNRTTCLHFDDYISDNIQIQNGTTQGCPISMPLYSFYNAPLIQSASNMEKTALGFVDNSMFLITSKSLPKAHTIIKYMMECPNGGFNWSIC